jgi:8-oxo-dGTP diphosphatase
MAAGGIVLRRQQPPLIAVVRLRKRDEWVLPKGKLDQGETPRAAARREVLEETGHNVTVHEFLGTLVCDSGGRSKIVHYWRMEAAGGQAHELMDDVRAVDWLPLEAALERLSRPSEQAFLEHVGPQALAALARRPKAKAPAARKRRGQGAVVATPALSGPAPDAAMAEPIAAPQPEWAPELTVLVDGPAIADNVVAEEMPVGAAEPEIAVTRSGPARPDEGGPGASSAAADRRRLSLAQKVRDWLSRAA